MNNVNDKAVAAVAALAGKAKRKYKKREPIFKTKFSFTDSNMMRVKYRNLKHDRRFDEKVPGLAIEVYPSGKINFFVFKNINMYNKKKNS